MTRLDVVGAVSLAVALSACADDQSTSTFDPTNASMTNVTGVGTSTSGPGSTDPTTSQLPTDPGGGTLGTESGATGEATSTTGVSTTTSSTDPGTTDGTTTSTTTDPGTSSTTDGGSSSTGVVPCDDALCPMGQFCDVNMNLCVPGCNDDTDCINQTLCDVNTNTCKGCLIDGDCPLGTVCDAGECVPGCNDNQPCQDGLACCTNTCIDLLVDVDNCLMCGNVCADPAHAQPVCNGGQCGLGACDAGWNDCDKNPANGCENQGACECDPGSMSACYTGPDNTAGVGICKTGTQTCNPEGTGYGPCNGEVTPNDVDICSNNLDDNCNGTTDENPDADGDGYTVCGGDCCDEVGPNCLNPDLVNPGAFEVMGNMVDDDCDGVEGNVIPACNNGLASNSNAALDYARAIDLCQFTTENPPQAMKKWGVISGSLTRTDGVGAMNANARSIRPGFGTNVVPQESTRLAILSTGNAADFNDNMPGYADFQPGAVTANTSNAPADWLAANGGVFPNAPGCPAAQSTSANDSAMLKLRIRVPTNAQSFSVKMYFYSAEWPEYVCTAFNDLFVTLVDSADAGNPADKNIAIYNGPNNTKYPVGVNIAKAAPGLFTQCTNGTISACGNPAAYNGCTGVTGLAGTGFDIVENDGCSIPNPRTGGGTGWLTMSGNVNGGETMEIRFAIWDTADTQWDSLVLLDDWEWSVLASMPGVQPN